MKVKKNDTRVFNFFATIRTGGFRGTSKTLNLAGEGVMESWILLLALVGIGGLILMAIAKWLRAVALWYWRVDEGIALLAEIRDELRDLNDRMDRGGSAEVFTFPRQAGEGRIEPR